MLALTDALRYLITDLLIFCLFCAGGHLLPKLLKRETTGFAAPTMALVALLTGIFAICATGGRTVLLPLPVLAGIYLFMLPRTSAASAGSRLPVMTAGILGVCLYFVFYAAAFHTTAPGLIRFPAGDYLYYARLLRNVNTLGVENPRLEYLYPDRFGVEVYHWGDIWFGAAINRLARIDFRHALLLGAYPLLAGICSMFAFEAIGNAFPKLPRFWRTILAVAVLVCGGLPILYPGFLYQPYIFTSGVGYYPKLLWVMAGGMWLLTEIRVKSYGSALIVTAIICISFITAAPALVLAAALFHGLAMRSGQLQFRQIVPAAVVLLLSGAFFVLFYKTQSRSSDNTGLVNIAKPELGSYMKTALICLGKGLFQLLRLLPYIIVTGLVFLLKKPRPRLRDLPGELRFLLIWIGAGLLAWMITEPFSWDAMQSYQSIFMIGAALLAIRLIALLIDCRDQRRYFLPAALVLLGANLFYNYRFDYQVEAAQKSDAEAAAAFLHGHSNGRFASIAAASRFSSKYGLNTALLYPLNFLDYRFAPFINASLDIPFVRIPAGDSSEARQIRALIDWAPFSYYVSAHPEIHDRDSFAAAFMQEAEIRDLIVEKGRSLPEALRPMTVDSLLLPTGSATIYRLR